MKAIQGFIDFSAENSVVNGKVLSVLQCSLVQERSSASVKLVKTSFGVSKITTLQFSVSFWSNGEDENRSVTPFIV